MFYINNIISEKHNMKSDFLDNVDHDAVLDYLKGRFFKEDKKWEKIY